MPKIFWSMKKTNNSGELTMYGPIAEFSWWGDAVTPAKFRDDLNALGDVDEIVVRLNSGGGDVFAGLHIYQLLKEHKAKITVRVEGLAASIASIIACAGDKIIMPKGSMMMIHNPWTSVWGAESNELRHTADVLDKIRDALVEVYSEKTGLSADEIKSLMDAEKWFLPDEAIENGFATEIEQTVQISASLRGKNAVFNGVTVDFSKFMNAPELPHENKATTQSALSTVASVLAMPQPNQNGSKSQPPQNDEMTLEKFAALHPSIYAAATNQGIEQERTRLKALDQLANTPGATAVVNKAKYESFATAAQAAIDILKADASRRGGIVASLLDDSNNSGAAHVTSDFGFQNSGGKVDAAANLIVGLINKNRGVTQ
ncbi:head maturation protease, ClpP-related [Paenibacillus sp. 481]|uniref:head maturation protease, ClpP-related n=1 Tax=Paenibacillus sp. 481 TaxID=2835869 RepID=UPI001E2C4542|nr:head maturation protease, ClpP-related [Paenibacillus sp. 481]UHA74471.1 Clp protease ClpP [Paenibacillus sp. 481]